MFQINLFKYIILNFFIFALILGKSDSDSSNECEICVDVLTKVSNLLKQESKNKNIEITEDLAHSVLLDYCKKTIDSKEEKLCNYIGAHRDSATSIMKYVTKPLSYGKPSLKICLDLKTKDSEICDLKPEKPIDWSSLDLKKLKVRQLQELLVKLNGDCKGCTEKNDYIRRINELKPNQEL